MTQRADELCVHGVTFRRLPDGSCPQCPECDLIWHEGCLEAANKSAAFHQRKVSEAIAAISRTCGDA